MADQTNEKNQTRQKPPAGPLRTEAANHGPTDNGATAGRLEIRKYPNRRYYDTTRSRHLTLEDINHAIRDGYEIRVTDSKSGQDITAKVLAQIILELDSPKLGVFPVPLLHRLIRANEQLVNDFVEKYFNQALSAFLDSQRSFEQSFRRAMGLDNLPSVPDWTKMMWGPFAPPFWSPQHDPSQNGGAPAQPPQANAPPAPPAPAQPQAEVLKQEMDDLRRQIEQLKQRVSSPPKPRKSAK